MNYRNIIATLILCNLLALGTIYYMAESTPRPIRSILQVAYNSYFVSCMDSLRLANYPQEYHFVVCKQSAIDYLQELSEAIGEDSSIVNY